MNNLVICLIFSGVVGVFSNGIPTENEFDWTQIKSPLRELVKAKNDDLIPKIAGMIVGGSIATEFQFPYQAALIIDFGTRGQYFCGGSIILPNFILTAAHCVYGLPDTVTVMVGLTDITGPSIMRYSVKRSGIIHHAQYNEANLRNDIALIKLPSNVPISQHVQIIPLAYNNVTLGSGEQATASGWGYYSDASQTVSNVLRYVNLPIVSNTICSTTYGTEFVRDSHICVSGANGRGTCSGDSGGPLVVVRNGTSVLIGVTSFGAELGCELGHPPVFTRISSFTNWIEANTNGSAKISTNFVASVLSVVFCVLMKIKY